MFLCIFIELADTGREERPRRTLTLGPPEVVVLVVTGTSAKHCTSGGALAGTTPGRHLYTVSGVFMHFLALLPESGKCYLCPWTPIATCRRESRKQGCIDAVSPFLEIALSLVFTGVVTKNGHSSLLCLLV